MEEFCDLCGKYIPEKDFKLGVAIHTVFRAFPYIEYETLCGECAWWEYSQKNDIEEQEL